MVVFCENRIFEIDTLLTEHIFLQPILPRITNWSGTCSNCPSWNVSTAWCSGYSNKRWKCWYPNTKRTGEWTWRLDPTELRWAMSVSLSLLISDGFCIPRFEGGCKSKKNNNRKHKRSNSSNSNSISIVNNRFGPLAPSMFIFLAGKCASFIVSVYTRALAFVCVYRKR